MQPQPLIGIFPDPILDDRSDGLHRSLNIDLACGIARRFYFLRQLGAKSMTGQADDPHAMDRTLDLAQEPGQHWIGSRLAAEESNLDPIGKVLVDQHRDVLAVSERLGEPARRVPA